MPAGHWRAWEHAWSICSARRSSIIWTPPGCSCSPSALHSCANATAPAPRIYAVSTYSPFERASYTGPYNLTGSPALSVPIGFENGLPLAFQIAGKPFDEAGGVRVGPAFEQATELHRQRPPIAASLPQHQ